MRFLYYICNAMKSIDLEKSIVATSTELFLTLGFKSVTMDDIAEEMKISKKTIYTFFANKEALVQSVVFSMYSYITTNLTQIREKASNPISELYEVKMFIMHQLKGEKTSPQHQLRKYYPNIHKELQKKQFDFMTKSVGKSLIKGVIMKLFDPQLISTLFLGCISMVWWASKTWICSQPKNTAPNSLWRTI